MSDITFNLKNIIILSLALLFLFLAVSRGFKTAETQKQERIQRFMDMSFPELGEYIVKKNNRKNNIDFITFVKPIMLKDETLIIDYYVKEGFVYDTISSAIDLEDHQKSLFNDLVSENCSKTAHRTFLNRGGKILYSYYLQEKGKEDKFLFRFDVVKGDCR